MRSPRAVAISGLVVTLVVALTVVTVLLQTAPASALSKNAALIAGVLGLGGVVTAQFVSTAVEDERARATRRLETERAQEARHLETERAQVDALQTYFGQMGELLNQGLRRKPYMQTEERMVATIQTSLVLRGLAPRRKWLVIEFLYWSGLLDRDAPLVYLTNADLRGAELCEYITEDAIDKSMASKYFGDADPGKRLSTDQFSDVLRGSDTDLRNVRNLLLDTNHMSAVLKETNLQDVIMIQAMARDTDLTGADLSGAYLLEADLIGATLPNAELGHAYLYDAVLFEADLNKSNLSGAGLNGAVLANAKLSGANLREANLDYANLRGADLRGADLRGAEGVTDEQLAKAKSLEGTIMPDGSVHT